VTHAERLQVFADQAASAIQNARSYAQAQELAAVEERQRLARDLHDEVSQTLWTASLLADVLPAQFEQNKEDALLSLEKLRKLTRGALAEMRTLLLELRPAALVETGIETLLVQLAEAAMSRKKIDIQVSVQGQRVLPQDVQIALYRIAQEAVNNIVKHARASQARITLACRDEHVRLSIRDNGRGFDLDQLGPDRLGLRIIQERAAAMDAIFEINSQLGEGAELVITWPEGALPCS
jgi:signal transduction histidine kinase